MLSSAAPGKKNFRPGRHDVKQLTLDRRVWAYLQRTALQERPHEDPTIGILVVQVRRIRAISGDIFQLATATFVTRQ
jgi:hypothetical protein